MWFLFGNLVRFQLVFTFMAQNRQTGNFFKAATLHSGSPLHRVVEQQLLIPGFLPEFLETSGDQQNLRFLEKVSTGNRTRGVEVGYLPTIPQQLLNNCSQFCVEVVKLSSFEVSKTSGRTSARSTTLSEGDP